MHLGGVFFRFCQIFFTFGNTNNKARCFSLPSTRKEGKITTLNVVCQAMLPYDRLWFCPSATILRCPHVHAHTLGHKSLGSGSRGISRGLCCLLVFALFCRREWRLCTWNLLCVRHTGSRESNSEPCWLWEARGLERAGNDGQRWVCR